jgi:hypothetical protein
MLALPWTEAHGYVRTPYHGGRIPGWKLVTSHYPNLRRLTQAAKRLPHVAACFSLRTRITSDRPIATPRYVVEAPDIATNEPLPLLLCCLSFDPICFKFEVTRIKPPGSCCS